MRYGNYVTDPGRFAPGSAIDLPMALANHLHGDSEKRPDGSFVTTIGWQGSTRTVAFTIDPDTDIVTEVPL